VNKNVKYLFIILSISSSVFSQLSETSFHSSLIIDLDNILIRILNVHDSGSGVALNTGYGIIALRETIENDYKIGDQSFSVSKYPENSHSSLLQAKQQLGTLII